MDYAEPPASWPLGMATAFCLGNMGGGKAESRSSHVQLDMSVKSVNQCSEKNNYDVLSVVNQSSRRQK